MFLLVSVRHIVAHPGGHQHGVSIQLPINLDKTLLRISRVQKNSSDPNQDWPVVTRLFVVCIFCYWSHFGFFCVGNMFVAIDVFMTEVRTGRIEPKESLITRIGILSISGALLEANDVMISFTACLQSVAFNAENLLVSGNSLGIKLLLFPVSILNLLASDLMFSSVV